jgi:hypothetical protein
MQCSCNSWHERNVLLMVLRFNESLKLAQSSVSLHSRQLRPSTNIRPILQRILHSSRVVDNATEHPFPLPRIFMLKEVHLTQLAT